MHDPKFEESVQRKMQDLEFVPSEAVWENIRLSVARPRRRRMIAAFWWWLAPGLLALGAGGMLYSHSSSAPAATAKNASGQVPQSRQKRGARPGSDGAFADEGGAPGAKTRADHAGFERAGVKKVRTIAAGGGSFLTETGETAAVKESAADPGSNTMAGIATRMSKRGSAPVVYLPGLIGPFGSRSEVRAPNLYPGPVNTAVSGIRPPIHPWRAGFAVGGGGSTIGQLAGTGSASGALAYSYASTLQSLATSAAPKRSLTVAKPDPSVSVGVYGEKRVSDHWYVNLGLNLRYYSTRLETSTRMNSYAPSSVSLFLPSPVTYTLNSANTYSSESMQTYVNRYFFLEIPATLQWRINDSRLMPLFWRGGAIFSYLVGSDAVYYDNASGSFNKDNGVARHAQASLNTGLMLGLPMRGLEIQAGPEVQYAVTKLLRTGAGGGHLLYGGVRLALMR